MQELTLVQQVVVWILPVLFGITVHEVAHGWVAKQLGDNTAWMLGRLTLNPIKHVDPVGTILIPGLLLLTSAGFIFGYAKPVPVNDRHFKNPKTDMAWVALAGPVANLLMALGWALLARIGVMINIDFVTVPLIYMGVAGITINLVLALINLLPIPPLDGGRIMVGVLPNKWSWYYSQLERYGFIILLLMLWTGTLSQILRIPLVVCQQFFFKIAGL